MITKSAVVPSILLLLFLIAFPQISETIYTPSLPTITRDLETSAFLVELSLSIYFVGFAIGVLFWGIFCDRVGRRVSMLYGLILYTLASIACYFSMRIELLLLFRVFQGMGAASGSVVTQTIMRDSFHGPKRSQLFSLIGAVLALSPALGPLIGGFAAEYWGWHANFAILIFMGIALTLYAMTSLPETKPQHLHQRSAHDFFVVAKKLLGDKRILSLALLIGCCNGIIFAFYAEGPFIFIDILGFSPSVYGLIGLVISAATIIGSLISHRANKKHEATSIIGAGLYIIGAGSALLCLGAFLGLFVQATFLSAAAWIVASLFIIFLGISLVIPNTLSIALVNYSHAAGTAGALFGLIYYLQITLFTALMSAIHNGSATPLCLLFFGLALTMRAVLPFVKAEA